MATETEYSVFRFPSSSDGDWAWPRRRGLSGRVEGVVASGKRHPGEPFMAGLPNSQPFPGCFSLVLVTSGRGSSEVRAFVVTSHLLMFSSDSYCKQKGKKRTKAPPTCSGAAVDSLGFTLGTGQCMFWLLQSTDAWGVSTHHPFPEPQDALSPAAALSTRDAAPHFGPSTERDRKSVV